MNKTCLILYSSLKATVSRQKEFLFFWTNFQVFYDNQVNISYKAMFFLFSPNSLFSVFLHCPFFVFIEKNNINNISLLLKKNCPKA